MTTPTGLMVAVVIAESVVPASSVTVRVTVKAPSAA
jgi:hypothetical protein